MKVSVFSATVSDDPELDNYFETDKPFAHKKAIVMPVPTSIVRRVAFGRPFGDEKTPYNYLM